MFWLSSSLVELDALLSVIFIIIYGLYSLKSKMVYLSDVYLFCRLYPFFFVTGFLLDSGSTGSGILSLSSCFASLPEAGKSEQGINLFNNDSYAFSLFKSSLLNLLPSFDMLLALLLFFIMFSFRSFEAVLLLLFAFIGQYYMLHSMDLLSFFIALEAQNFCFLVLCGHCFSSTGPAFVFKKGAQQPSLSYNKYTGGNNHSFTVEASLKYFLLSAFSSGVILFWFSILYLQTGSSSIYFLAIDSGYFGNNIYSYQILCAMMFKLGAAPLHLWVVQIYNGVKRQLILYIATAPKLALFGFWINSFSLAWTDYTLLLFSLFSLILGSFGAYSVPGLRSLFAYSTINEIGLLLSALEIAGFSSLMQHLSIYIISQLLLWNIDDKRLFSFVAVSLAGLPPLAGFFGKAWILWNLASTAPTASQIPSVATQPSNQTAFGEGEFFKKAASLASLPTFGEGKNNGSLCFSSTGLKSTGLYTLLLVALFCTAVSLVYYLRVLRLFFNNAPIRVFNGGLQADSSIVASHKTVFVQYNKPLSYSVVSASYPAFGKGCVARDSRILLTSSCAILLMIIPFFFIKPFVL